MEKVNAHLKEKTAQEVFTSASSIVDDILLENVDPQSAVEALPRYENLVCTVNRPREKKRPKYPQSLDFTLVEEHILENFLMDDIEVDGQHHLIFASDHMLDLLSKTKTWYMDGTFRVIWAPCQQLFSIHAFLRKNNDMKQVPLLSVIMSSCRKRNYKAVIRSVLQMVPQEVKCGCAFLF